ncbi:hypothetical protein BRC79_09530 [Halobacteriales archaeon QH_8_67_27]|nr:MAG: hypothetical protein BRC79_09530 [Halobacteriales archaeon QH_8_67_27]
MGMKGAAGSWSTDDASTAGSEATEAHSESGATSQRGLSRCQPSAHWRSRAVDDSVARRSAPLRGAARRALPVRNRGAHCSRFPVVTARNRGAHCRSRLAPFAPRTVRASQSTPQRARRP